MNEQYLELCGIEEYIEKNFIALAELEINGINDVDYHYYYSGLVSLVESEKALVGTLGINARGVLNLLNDANPYKKEPIIGLGHVSEFYYFRLINIFKSMVESDLAFYAETVQYDINNLLLRFLSKMIDNEYFQNIREELIYFKYNIIFLNMDSEYDFLTGEESKPLETKKYRTEDFSDYTYVDDSLLGFQSMQALSYLYSIEDDFKNNSDSYTKVVLCILNILVRLILCEDQLVNKIYPEFIYLIGEDNPSENLRETMKEMLDILNEIKNDISWSR